MFPQNQTSFASEDLATTG